MRRPSGAGAPPHLVFLAAVFGSGLVVLSLYRAIFWLVLEDTAPAIPAGALARAFLTGVRFDASVSGYLVGGPLLVLSALAVLGVRVRAVERVLGWAIAAGYASVFLVAAADIPWYRQFGTRLTVAALAWADTPGFFVESAIGDSASWPFLALFAASGIGFGVHLGRLRRRLLEKSPNPGRSNSLRNAVRAAAWSLGAVALVFLAARGRIAQSSPLRTGAAFFSSNPLANQLGLNPAFTFWNSLLDARSERLPEAFRVPPEKALAAARLHLGLGADPRFDSPIARIVDPGGEPRDVNVVVVIMEAMAASRLERHGGHGLTPRLDALEERGLSFDRVYASGVHTYSGVYSTLFSLPTAPGEHPMKGARILRPFAGLARVLSERGYGTVFLCPHDGEIDNMAGFLGGNGFERVLDLDDWPEDRITPNLRLPDHELFDRAIPILGAMSAEGKPFLATILTVSNHPRYFLPDGIPFRPRSADPALRAVEYADWSIGRFVDLASREPWFSRTLFVFVADHGVPEGLGIGRTLAQHHVPLIFFGPAILGAPRRFGAIGGQIDVAPTLLGLLGRAWVDNTLGIDLLRERRSAIYFSDDDAIGCLDGERFLLRNRDGAEALYRLPGGEPEEDPGGGEKERLRSYALAMIETARFLVDRNLAGPQTPAKGSAP